MQYYAIQVMTTEVDDFIRRAAALEAEGHGHFFSPKRLMPQIKAGKKTNRLLHVFPGYVFLEIEELRQEDRWVIRHMEGFCRFLKNSTSPTPLSEKDRQVLRHFMSFGEYADISRVTFDEKDRIVVLEGPLKGLEGEIVKVDRRRGRAKVSLDICSTGFFVDLAFTVVDKVKTGGGVLNDGS